MQEVSLIYLLSGKDVFLEKGGALARFRLLTLTFVTQKPATEMNVGLQSYRDVLP